MFNPMYSMLNNNKTYHLNNIMLMSNILLCRTYVYNSNHLINKINKTIIITLIITKIIRLLHYIIDYSTRMYSNINANNIYS